MSEPQSQQPPEASGVPRIARERVNGSARTSLQHHASGARCLHCGYNLQGTLYGPCPECGEVLDAKAYRRLRAVLSWCRRMGRRSYELEIALCVLVMFSLPFIGFLFLGWATGGYVTVWPFLLFTVLCIWPMVSLALGMLVLSPMKMPFGSIHRTMWMGCHLWLWIPSWVWIPYAAFAWAFHVWLPLHGGVLATGHMAIGVVLTIAAAWWAWKRWMRANHRISAALSPQYTLWPPRVVWLPVVALLLATLLGLVSVVFGIVEVLSWADSVRSTSTYTRTTSVEAAPRHYPGDRGSHT